MSANTEMSRLDSLPTATLNSLLSLADSLPTSIKNPQDGDVLVYNGTKKKWENGEGGSGGGEDVAVNYTVTWDDETGDPSVTTETSFSDILSALSSGKTVTAHVYGLMRGDSSSTGLILPLEYADFTETYEYVLFGRASVDGENIRAYQISHAADGISFADVQIGSSDDQ